MILTRAKIESIDPDQVIDDYIQSGKLNELLLVVPTNRKIRSLKKIIISSSPGSSTGKINLETIGTFSSSLFFSDVSAKNKMLSEAASTVLLSQSFKECSLKYFKNKNEIPSGTLERIKNVISEYKKHGITPAKLLKESKNLEGIEKIKAEDISFIYEKYKKKCDELKVKETGDIYESLNSLDKEIFNRKFRELYPEVKLVVINGFDEFTIPEIEIIDSVSKLKGIELFIYFDYYKYNPLIFSHLDKCYDIFISKGFTAVQDKSISGLNHFQNKIREELFKRKSDAEKEKTGITKITALNREKEIEFIAKEIKNLIEVNKTEPHKICAAFNLIHKYSPVVRDIFSTYGIPFNLTDRFSLDTSPPVISVINFLEILENDFYYKNIFRALSSGFLNIESVDPSNLLKASVKLKVISGIRNWRETLSDAINKKDYDEDDFGFDRDVFIKALNDIDIIEDHLAPFNKKMSIREFEAKLNDLIFSLNLHRKLINNLYPAVSNENDGIEKNIKAATIFNEIIKEILNLFLQEYGGEEKFSLKFFLNNIRTAVSSSRYNIKEKSNYGIQVTTLNEIRGLKFDYLFIAGLCDGDLPTRYTPEIFLSGTFARSERRHQTEERYHFYQSLCSWEKALYLSYPKTDERQELAESGFLKEFGNLFSFNDKDEKDYSSGIYSREELLIFIGKNIDKEIKPDEYYPDIDKIKESVKVDRVRMNDPFGDSEYTGVIKKKLSEEGKENLEKYADREYSITQLETYAKCPYKYFAERILKLKPVEEPSEEVEALEMGSLLHNIFYEFYSTIRKKGIVIQNASGEDFKTAVDILFEAAENKIEEANFNSPLTFYEKEKILGINGNRRNSLLYLFLKTEKENDKNLLPEFFEVVFGNFYYGKNQSIKEKEFKLKELKAGNVNIRGKIDRIDIDKLNNRYEVIDYKLGGTKPTQNELAEGLSLQLPLYMYAAKELINAQLNKDLSPDVPKIYSLKSRETKFGKQPVNLGFKKNTPDKEKETVLNNLIYECVKFVEEYVRNITEGKFNLSELKDRENKVCQYCSFKPLCRIREIS